MRRLAARGALFFALLWLSLGASFSQSLPGWRGNLGGAGCTWQTVLSTTLADDAGHTWPSYTLRQFIPQASLAVTGGTMMRLTLKANTAATNIFVNKMYAQQADATYAATTPKFNLALLPVQVFFSGSATVTLTGGAGAQTVSDAFTLGTPASQGLLVSWELDSSSNPMPGNAAAPTGGIMSYKLAADAATVNASGYTDYSGFQKSYLISKYEVCK